MKEKLFTKIFNLYVDDIYRLVFSYTHNKEDTDDIIQKVFLQFYNHITELDKDETEIKKWLIIIAINECKDLFKTAWKKHIIPLQENMTFKDNKMENQFAINEDFKYYLNKLKPKYRLIFHLYYYYGYNTKEIAKLLKIKENTIRQRLLRGRQILKIEKEGENEKV